MLKVLSVIPSFTARCGGPILNLAESVPHLRAAGVKVTIFSTDLASPVSTRPSVRATADELAPVPSDTLSLFPWRFPSRVAFSPSLRAALSRCISEFDLVRIHGAYLYPHWAAFKEAQTAKVPYIVSPHGSLDPWIRARGRIRKSATNLLWQDRMFRNASAIHATSHEELRLISDVAPNTQRYVVGNGVDYEAFQTLPPRGPFRCEHQIPSNAPLILFLGRISAKKGVDVLIQSFREVLHRVPDAYLAIVGPDDEGLTPSLRAHARQNGVGNRVAFAGPRYGDDRLAALADADLWALPSHTENFGNAVIEAMAAGVPVAISTQVNLAPDVQADRAGLVAPPVAAAFAEALVKPLLNPALHQDLASAGRAFAAKYSWPSVAARLAGMFSDVVMRHRAVGPRQPV